MSKSSLLAGVLSAVDTTLVGVTIGATRASVGYAAALGLGLLGASSTLTQFANDTRRLTSKGTIVEAAATNKIIRSQEFNLWTKTGCTAVLTTDVPAPDGTLTACLVTDTAANTQHSLSLPTAALSVVSGHTYSGSVFVKAGTWQFIQLCYASSGFGGLGFVNIDIVNGIVGTISGVNASNGVGLEAFSNGWYRIWINEASDGTTGASNFIINMAASLTATKQLAYVGTGSTVYVWGAQVEDSTAPSSYFPTTTATASRATDVVTATSAGLAAGSIVIKNSYAPGIAGTNVLCQWDDGTENNRIRLYLDSSSVLHFVVTDGGVDQCDISALGTVPLWGALNVACGWSSGSFALSINGQTALTDAAGTIPVGLTTLRLGSDSTGNYWNGYIGTPRIHNTRRSNAVLAADCALVSEGSELIIDLDHDSDIDDAGDVALALALEQAGKGTIIAIVVTSANTAAVGAVYAELKKYGRENIPIGVNTGDPGNASSAYVAQVVAAFPNVGHSAAANFPSSNSVLRQALLTASDNNVEYITTGGAQSLYDLHQTAGDAITPLSGLQLVAQKIKTQSIVAGAWPSGALVSDMNTSATTFVWLMNYSPSPLLFCDVAGSGPNYLGASFEAMAADNPLRYAWETYHSPADPSTATRQAWSGPAILRAYLGYGDTLQKGGQFGGPTISSGTKFRPQVNKGHSWLAKIASDATLQTIINAYIVGDTRK